MAAVSLNPDGHPLYTKMTPVSRLTRTAIAAWAAQTLAPSGHVTAAGVVCLGGVTDAGCDHQTILVGTRKPKHLPAFNWVNTLLVNLKTRFGGADHAFDME